LLPRSPIDHDAVPRVVPDLHGDAVVEEVRTSALAVLHRVRGVAVEARAGARLSVDDVAELATDITALDGCIARATHAARRVDLPAIEFARDHVDAAHGIVRELLDEVYRR
jgi:hypothetical protein